MVVLIIFPVILQTVINVIGLMLSIGGQGGGVRAQNNAYAMPCRYQWNVGFKPFPSI